MSRYAVVDGDNVVINVIVLDDETKFSSENTLIQSDAADIGGTIVDGIYTPSAGSAYTPTAEEIREGVQREISARLLSATNKIATLQDAVDLDIATADEITSLTAWKTYRVAVNRVPTQSGYPTNIDWPEQPL